MRRELAHPNLTERELDALVSDIIQGARFRHDADELGKYRDAVAAAIRVIETPRPERRGAEDRRAVDRRAVDREVSYTLPGQ
jgi:hypothetical protein